MKFSRLKLGIAALSAVGTAAIGMAAQSDTPDLLQSLERGLWQLRAVGGWFARLAQRHERLPRVACASAANDDEIELRA
mgnify:CR=1 FL=1